MEAVWQDYEVRVNDEFVLRGNAALLKCLVPSYVSDVVQIESWTSSQGEVFGGSDWGKQNHHIILHSPFYVLVTVVSQSYQVHVHDEYVLLGNAGLLRCLIPSFVSDFVIVDTWVGDDGTHITADSHGIDSQATNHTHTHARVQESNLHARILAALFRSIRECRNGRKWIPPPTNEPHFFFFNLLQVSK